jgi:hypothetical protein
MLHILNGDSTAGSLGQSGLPGKILAWAEALHEGPVPAQASPEEWRRVRAHFYAQCGWGTVESNLAKLLRADQRLETYLRHEEAVLWFEHDLFDQLLLIRLLDWFAVRPLGGTQLSLICIDRFPGVTNFHGLGELRPEQLASLFDTRTPITPSQLDLGQRAWAAYASEDPRALEALIASDTRALPFLAPALVRHLEEFPSVQNGLSRTEADILTTLAIAGQVGAADLFVRNMQGERWFYMGDASFARVIQGLAEGPQPAIVLGPPRPAVRNLLSRQAAITPVGRDVLACRADWVRLRVVDRWLGGVYLHGPEAAWRWDDFHRRLVPSVKA